MTDVFERFERMDNLLRQELIRVVEEKIRKEEEIKANKKRQTRKKVDKRIVPIDKLPILIEFAKQKKDKIKPSIKDSIASDNDICKKSHQMQEKFSDILKKLNVQLETWKGYKHFWEDPKFKFIEMQIKPESSASQLKDHIGMFRNMYNKVQDTKQTVIVDCIQIENNNIKNKIMNILLEWQTSSEERIKMLCLKQLKELHDRFKTVVESFDLNHPIHNLISLKKNKDFLEEQKAAVPKIQAQIGPFHEKFKQIEE